MNKQIGRIALTLWLLLMLVPAMALAAGTRYVVVGVQVLCGSNWDVSDEANRMQLQPDGTYVKVHPAEGQPPVDSQMAMFGYFQNGFVQETDKPEKPKAESKPKAAAVKAAVKPVPRQRAALRPKRAGLLQNLFGRGKK